MGFSLANIGRKLHEYEGDVGKFFGGAAQAVGNVANATSKAVGGTVLKAPVVSDAVRFGQQQNPTIGDFVKGISSVGYNNSPVGAIERTGGRMFATATNRPLVSLTGTSLPIKQEIGGAAPVFGNKLAGQALATLGIAGDAAYGVSPFKAPVRPAVKLAGRKVVQANEALGQEGKIALPGPGEPTAKLDSGLRPGGGNDTGVDVAAAQKPTVKIVNTPAGKVTVKPEPWTAPPEPVDMPPVQPNITEKARKATGKNNPVKIDLPEVAPGNHQAAIVNSQRAADLVDKTSGFALKSARALAKEDDALLPRAIEHPELVKTAKDPVKLQQAINDFRRADDTAHAVNQTLKGEPTAYRTNHALHDWQLPEDMAPSPDTFRAVKEQARIHPTIEHGEAAGLTLKDRPHAAAMAEYFQRASGALRKQALVKGLGEADTGAELNQSFDLGGGNAVKVSEAGKKALKGLERQQKPNVVLRAHDATNKALKQTLLSISQFHPLNIGRKAGSAMTLAGHPLNAVKGVRDSFLAINKHYSENLQRRALSEGTFDDAARIGTPIGVGSDYTVSGGFNPGKHGVGERTIFEQQMPAIHVQMVRSVVADLKKRGISLDSREALQAGTRVNEIMGYVNKEVRGLDTRTQKFLGRILLAPQFTRSKWATLKGVATDKGLARKYAIAAVLGDTAAVYATSVAVGALLGQKQDNWRDTMLRALIHPSIATPFKDKKGNNIELSLPSTYISEAFGLLGSLTRGENGRMKVSVKPGEVPGNIANYGRARLAPLESDALKVSTNENYAGKPLYDPQASMSDRLLQVATTLGEGHLPIGAQGALHTDVVKRLLPKASQDVLTAGDSGLPGLVKSGASALGLSARTDKTTGKGLQTTQYFDARNAARSGLNKNDQAVFDAIHPDSKNPVTGQYQTSPTVWDGQTKASNYLAHPNVLEADNKLNQELESHGQKIDPFFKLTPKEQSVFLTYSTLNQDDPQKTRMAGDHSFISNLQTARSAFFDSLPPGDPNKPKAPVAYPEASKEVSGLQDQYFKLTDSTQKALFLKSHPELSDQFAAQDEYNRTVRGIKNLPQYDKYPKADSATQKILDTYNALPKKENNGKSTARSSWIKAHPADYAKMSQYLTQTSLYSLEQSAGQAAFEGKGFDQKGLKAISGLSKDIGTYTDSNGNTFYALGADGSSSGSGGRYGSRPKKAVVAASYSPLKYAVSRTAGGTIKKGKVSIKQSSAPRSKAVAKAKPKVSIKKARA